MRLIAVSMIRNEADILPDFLGHCAALFDEVLAVDHSSADGTSEMLEAAARRMPLTVWRFPYPAKAQGLVCTALAREAAARGADWIVPLDADEFPLFPSRAALEERLAGPQRVVVWRWRNAYAVITPQDFAAFSVEGHHHSLRRHTPKVVIPRREVTEMPRFSLGRGCHTILPHDATAAAAREQIGELLHLPIRHADRFRLKLEQNLAASRALAHWPETHGIQYRQAEARQNELLATGNETMRRRFALFYPTLRDDEPPGVEPLEVSLLGRLEGLPAPPDSVEEVLARERSLTWEVPPDPERQRWRLVLEPGLARLVPRQG